MNYTNQINIVTYINKDGTIIKLEKDSLIYNSLFNLDAIEEDIYSEQDGEDII